MVSLSHLREELALEHMAHVSALWRRRASMVRSRAQGLKELLRLDEKLRTHIDGMAAAGSVGWGAATRTPRITECGDVFTTLILAGLRGDRERLEETVSGYIGRGSVRPAVISALAWLGSELVMPMVEDWLGYHLPAWRGAALAVCVARRSDPGSAIDRGLLDGDCDVRRQAVRACEVFGCRAMMPTLAALASGGSDELRFAVARALHVLGDPAGPERLWHYALIGTTNREEAAELATRNTPMPMVRSWFDDASLDPALRRVVVVGAAATGDLECVPRLLEALHDSDVAALAGYGLQVIVGLDVEANGLSIARRPSRDPELPYPDAERVHRWWHTNRRHFEGGPRFLLGRPLGRRALQEALCDGPQRVRLLAAFDLHRIRDGYSVPFEIDAPSWRQLRWLGCETGSRL